MARARAAHAKGMAREKAALLATAHDEAAGATQRVSILGDEPATARQAKDAAKEMILSLAAEVAMANRRREPAKKKCKHLVHELTLLRIRESEMCITIIGAPLLTPLHEGMCFAVAQHTEVATRLSTLWMAVSLASQSILGRLLIDVPQAGVVGEIVVRFWERASWCLCLEAIGQEICDHVLGSAGDKTCLVAHLEDAVGRCEASRETLRVHLSWLVTQRWGRPMRCLP
jgi:hypothetical protein